MQDLDDGIPIGRRSAGSPPPLPSDDNETDPNSDTAESSKPQKPHDLPCRVLLKVRGAQWFIYNRTPAYDAILQSMVGPDEVDPATTENTTPLHGKVESSRSSEDPKDVIGTLRPNDPPKDDDILHDSAIDEKGVDAASTKSTTAPTIPSGESWNRALPSILNILPIGVECGRAAIVMGNQSTRSILVAKVDRATGKFTAHSSRSVDLYKQVIDFDFVHPTVDFKYNKDYKDMIFREGAKLCSQTGPDLPPRPSWYDRFHQRQRVRRASDYLRDFLPHRRGSVDDARHLRPRSGHNTANTHDEGGAYGQSKWLGLTRYLDEDDDTVEQERWRSIEYAQVPNIVDCPSVSMNLYWDVPGTVPEGAPTVIRPNYTDDINGDAPPDWGIELKVRGGTINYGPWADRQRTDLQTVFFPTLYRDAKPAVRLEPGATRLNTELKIFLIIEEQVTLRIPTREDSKDWKWRGKAGVSAAADPKQKKKQHGKGKKGAGVNQGSGSRPFGWIDVRVLPDSTVSFVMDLVANVKGYRNRVDVDLKGLELSSSVNHALFWRSQSQTISCDLSNPLGWNTLRKWQIDLHDKNLELFILRDHMFLITDLINDWASGPDPEFHTFVPFEYSLSLRFMNFRLYVNANDSNIIDNPADVTDNTFLVIWGQELIADILIPIRNFRPSRNKVEFDVDARDGGFELLTPFWNTQHAFLDGGDVASLRDLRINGSYNYFTTTSPTLTDILLLNLHGVTPRVRLYGFLIRYFMNIKDNYFGDDMHFRTLEEYQRQLNPSDLQKSEDPNAEHHQRPTNDLDVILVIKATDCLALLPAHLYSAEEYIQLEILSVSADLRITNYYMDLAVSSSPISVSQSIGPKNGKKLVKDESRTQLYIDGLEVTGHRLFGLPPSEPTYVCNWDFDVGQISGECSLDFLRMFLLAVQCFALSFDDQENALPPIIKAAIYDITFLRARVHSVLVALRIEDAAVILGTKAIKVDFNDWAGSLFSDRLYALIPELTLAITDSDRPHEREHNEDSITKTHAYMRTSIEINQVSRKPDFIHNRQLQQGHVTLHDSRTHRVPWLIPQSPETPLIPPANTKLRPPAMPFPLMPTPVSRPRYRSSVSQKSSSKSGVSAKSRGSSFLVYASESRRSNNRKRGQGSQRSFADDQERLRRSYQSSTSYHSLHTSSKSVAGPVSSNDSDGPEVRSSSRQRCVQHGLAFSSPYKRPYFPLLGIVPNTSEVPALPEKIVSEDVEIDDETMEQVKTQLPNTDSEQTSIFINFGQGLQAFCTPMALLLLIQIQDQLQPDEVTSLLDNLHIDTIKDVLTADDRKKHGSSSTDFHVSASYFAMRFVSSGESRPNVVSAQEHYEISFINAIITARNATEVPDNPAPTKHQLALHVLMDQIQVSARESRSNSDTDQAIISIHIHSPMLWILQGSKTSAELQLDDLEIISASKRVDYISSLIRQTVLLSEDLASRVSNNSYKHRLRLQLYVLLLAEEGHAIPNPPFLSGASYVLRSATNHLRTNNSWRMIARLRYVQNSLSEDLIEKLQSRCVNDWASCPINAGRRAISVFGQWQTWDIGNVASSILLQKVYGTTSTSFKATKEQPSAGNASVRARRLRLVVDPGASQNEFVVERCLFGFSFDEASVGNSKAGHAIPTKMISAYCSNIALRLNWSLCELVENIVETMQTTHLIGVEKQQSPAVIPASKRSCLHLVVSSEMSILNIDTINVKAVTVCKALKFSVIRLNGRHTYSRGSTSLIIDAAAAKTDVLSSSSILSVYNLHKPQLFGSQESGGLEKPWKFVGSSHRISFELLRTPLELAEVADSFIRDEIAHLNQWFQSLPIERSSNKTQEPAGPPKAHVALLLDSYLVGVAILPSLVYEVQGTGLRSSIQSGLSQPSLICMNVDLKEHSHVFKSDTQDGSSEISALKIPPICGYFRLDLAPERKMLAFRYLAEHISLSAHSLHAIFDAINRPAIIELGKEMNNEFQAIQRHIDVVFQKDGTHNSEAAPTSAPFLFDANATIAGFTIHASTPESPSLGQAADLDINLGRIRLQGTNIDVRSGSVLPISELQVQLRTIRVELLRPEDLISRSCGNLALGVALTGTSKVNEAGKLIRAFQIESSRLDLNLYTETASAAVAILGHLQDTLKTIDLPSEVKGLHKLGRERLRREGLLPSAFNGQKNANSASAAEFSAMYSLLMANIQIAWRIGDAIPLSPSRKAEDLILSFRKIDLATKQDNAARLLIDNMQLQMMPASQAIEMRSLNSALLPEVIFNVAYKSTKEDRRLAFQAVGKSLDLQLTSQFILPANDLRRSIAIAAEQVRTATQHWISSTPDTDAPKKNLLGNKRLASLLVYADFAGAEVHIQGRSVIDPQSMALSLLRGGRPPQHGRYNQFTPDNSNNSSATLRAPGIALKVEYKDAGVDAQSLNAEMKVSASSNTLFPTVVPLVLEVTSSIKEIVGDTSEDTGPQERRESKMPQPRFLEDERLRTADPTALLGNCKLNLGLRICKQEFSLSCQPIARVAARARFEDIYITLNTVQSAQHGKFFTVSGAFTKLQMSVQHVYSRDSTGSFDVDSIVVSFMNSRHVSSANGISAILKISPMKVQINAKQLQDFLLFREIWVPPEVRQGPTAPEPTNAMSEPQVFIVQRYQQIAAAGAFPWNATVSIEQLDVQLDLGQSLGKSVFKIADFWIASRKSSDWEQYLCLGFERVAVDSTGRMSGTVELQNFKVRTSIRWPILDNLRAQTPLVQASMSFDHLRVKAGFDFQSFLVADISSLDFLMYNTRDPERASRDRLVGVLEGDKVQIFCTATSASQALALYQAFQRLIEEKQKAYEASLSDIEKFLRRKSSINPLAMRAASSRQPSPSATDPYARSPLRLQTNVVVALKAVNLGAFPSTFMDSQIFKLEALETSARFNVVLDQEKIHSSLGMTLGQLRVALSSVNRSTVPKTLGEVSIADVVASATGSRGGTILKVPKVIANMQTWQEFDSTRIDYVFKSSFQGKVDVGWNYSRISYIRGMHANHVRTLAQRLGKPLPQSAVQITGLEAETGKEKAAEGGQEKITAVVNVPQSKYQYTALEPPIIETPQLRDMGEATPPLEWIGLQRDRLPNLTHQIVIVTLLEVAKEVDDAYSRILGSS